MIVAKPAFLEETPQFKPAECRQLQCFVCEEKTEFHLNEEGTVYECTVCGWAMDYIANNGPHLYAMTFFDGIPVERKADGIRQNLLQPTPQGS